ncbi:transglycosylase SLT domain-containing protein [Hahella aquimaris]|uniref:transglycosylase SLT domain-containing protein n=1 Tax=Hahella sp. HNIBRBA332 TaxID=3015983 RepID=UPI00273C16FD|nr:transglycosylase SLT domain-containing protein [Hahella sp. HNIBRBA332]WLQ14512.1 transglycosylase SLT domain-containing protein [Hahella sp. HNIBRBA332]
MKQKVVAAHPLIEQYITPLFIAFIAACMLGLVVSAWRFGGMQSLFNAQSGHGRLLPDADALHAAYYSNADPIHDADRFPGHVPQYAYAKEVRRVAVELDMEERLLYAVARTESSLRPDVRSDKGAMGLMQVVAGAGGREAYKRLYKKSRNPTEKELADPYTNLKLGGAYLKILRYRYFGQVEDRTVQTMLVLAAYNWGPSNVRRKIVGKFPVQTREQVLKALQQDAPTETYQYVRKVMRYMDEFARLSGRPA